MYARIRTSLKNIAAMAILLPVAAFAKTATTTSLATPVSPVSAGTVVTLTATVSPVTNGQVKFCNAAASRCVDTALLGVGQVTSAGTVTIKIRPGMGTHNFDAVFGGNNTYTASTSSTQAVTVAAPSTLYTTNTTMAASGTTGNYTLSGSVTAPGNYSLSGETMEIIDATSGGAEIASTLLETAQYETLGQVSYTTGYNPFGIVVGDFNGDGILDVAVSNSAGTVSILGHTAKLVDDAGI